MWFVKVVPEFLVRQNPLRRFGAPQPVWFVLLKWPKELIAKEVSSHRSFCIVFARKEVSDDQLPVQTGIVFQQLEIFGDQHHSFVSVKLCRHLNSFFDIFPRQFALSALAHVGSVDILVQSQRNRCIAHLATRSRCSLCITITKAR